jgi:AraC-like DNA-binding protein
MGVYRELEPRPELRDHLACVWYRTTGPDEPAQVARVLPDACIDVVWAAGSAPLIAGPDTGPASSSLAPGTAIAGARFRTGLAPGLLGVAAAELRDARPPLEAVWGGRDVRRLEQDDGLGRAEAMLDALQRALLRRPAGPGPGPLLPAVIGWAAGARPLAHLLREVSAPERTLRRHVAQRVGYGPRTLRRVLRFQRLLRLAATTPSSLADLALAAGYADQAHLSRECRNLSGLSPARLLPELLPDGRWREAPAARPR